MYKVILLAHKKDSLNQHHWVQIHHHLKRWCWFKGLRVCTWWCIIQTPLNLTLPKVINMEDNIVFVENESGLNRLVFNSVSMNSIGSDAYKIIVFLGKKMKNEKNSHTIYTLSLQDAIDLFNSIHKQIASNKSAVSKPMSLRDRQLAQTISNISISEEPNIKKENEGW